VIKIFIEKVRKYHDLECEKDTIDQIYMRIVKDTLNQENTKLYSFSKFLKALPLKGLTDIDGNIYLNTDPEIDPTTNMIIQRP
jgi:hypothetical protein